MHPPRYTIRLQLLDSFYIYTSCNFDQWVTEGNVVPMLADMMELSSLLKVTVLLICVTGVIVHDSRFNFSS